MMAIMMTGGISLRAFGLVPNWFIAFFYTGLGIALALSGMSFLGRFVRRGNLPVPCPALFRSFSREKAFFTLRWPPHHLHRIRGGRESGR